MTSPNNKPGSDKSANHIAPSMEDFRVNMGAIHNALGHAANIMQDNRNSDLTNDMQKTIAPVLKVFCHEAARAQIMCSDHQQSCVQAAMCLLQLVSNQEQTSLETTAQQAKPLIASYMSARQVATTFQSNILVEARKADTQLSTSACFDTIQSTTAVWNPCYDWTMLVLFSDIFEVARNSHSSKDTVWKAPASFERQTTKYWIQKGKLMDVVFGIVGDAPLLVYGNKGSLSQMLDANNTQILTESQQNKLASTISSVYFDGLDNMCLYKDRIRRLEGAQLFRIRWYGEKKPKGNKNVFLELKTHHEKWVGDKSVKERVELQEKDVYEFVTETSNKLTHTQAKRLVKTASPKLKGADLDKAINLLLTIHRLIRKKKLHPCVRSQYRRLAFQSATKNDIRVTIDQNVTLIDERSTPDGSWCLPDEMITADKMKQVPFDIFEVKIVSGETIPESVASLEDAQSIVLAEKFSKFLTGAAVFNASKVGTLPYWASHQQFAPLFGQEVTVVTKQQNRSLSKRLSTTTEMSSEYFSDNPNDPEMQKLTDQKASRFGMPIMRHLPWQRNSKKTPSIAPVKPARVEPKSYFANERTFVQWLSSALLLVTVAVLLLEFNSQHEEYPLLAIGLGLLGCTGVLILYALFTYFRRIRMLESGQGYGYVDHFAPVFLAVAIFSGLFALLAIFISTGSGQLAQKRLSNMEITSRGDECIRHPMEGVSLLEYQPSDVAVYEERGWLLVPSLDTIRAHDLSGESIPVRTLATVPGMDIEGLTIVDDTIYAVSENNEDDGFSQLLAMEWNSFGLLHEVQRWKLRSKQTEGITYIKESNELLISSYDGAIDKYPLPEVGDNTTLGRSHHLNARLLTDGLSDPKIASLQFFEDRLYVLHDNAKVVRVWDLERGELLSEWNLPHVRGKSDKQWEGLSLERVGSGATTSGLRGLSSNEPDTPLLLHLSLDSPPQLWTLAVREGSNGDIIFPSCAAVPDH